MKEHYVSVVPQNKDINFVNDTELYCNKISCEDMKSKNVSFPVTLITIQNNYHHSVCIILHISKENLLPFCLISLFLLMDRHSVNCTAGVIFTNTLEE
jgi:hypothetical protein